jgi:hypothetical protein
MIQFVDAGLEVKVDDVQRGVESLLFGDLVEESKAEVRGHGWWILNVLVRVDRRAIIAGPGRRRLLPAQTPRVRM